VESEEEMEEKVKPKAKPAKKTTAEKTPRTKRATKHKEESSGDEEIQRELPNINGISKIEGDDLMSDLGRRKYLISLLVLFFNPFF
jgi:hypothetical protein